MLTSTKTCPDCHGEGTYDVDITSSHDWEPDAVTVRCECCGGCGEVDERCYCCAKVAELTSRDDDGHGYCHACDVVHFRGLARDRFRAALRTVVALPEAAE